MFELNRLSFRNCYCSDVQNQVLENFGILIPIGLIQGAAAFADYVNGLAYSDFVALALLAHEFDIVDRELLLSNQVRLSFWGLGDGHLSIILTDELLTELEK